MKAEELEFREEMSSSLLSPVSADGHIGLTV
jgi:hypothetical protein